MPYWMRVALVAAFFALIVLYKNLHNAWRRIAIRYPRAPVEGDQFESTAAWAGPQLPGTVLRQELAMLPAEISAVIGSKGLLLTPLQIKFGRMPMFPRFSPPIYIPWSR